MKLVNPIYCAYCEQAFHTAAASNRHRRGNICLTPQEMRAQGWKWMPRTEAWQQPRDGRQHVSR